VSILARKARTNVLLSSKKERNYSPRITRANDEAAKWLAKEVAGDMSDVETDRLDSWISASEINRRSYEELCAIFLSIENLSAECLSVEYEQQLKELAASSRYLATQAP
jgi:ferric-dicitrate binding protein FerR (iron transport regulator)